MFIILTIDRCWLERRQSTWFQFQQFLFSVTCGICSSEGDIDLGFLENLLHVNYSTWRLPPFEVINELLDIGPHHLVQILVLVIFFLMLAIVFLGFSLKSVHLMLVCLLLANLSVSLGQNSDMGHVVYDRVSLDSAT